MIKSEKSFGMIPSDLLIAGAISEAIDDLRKNPWLLDYCFNWFASDDLTAKYYGDAAKLRAKDWFLKHKISVRMSTMLTDPTFPQISINLQSAVDEVATLGDVNYETNESLTPEQQNINPQIILGPFTVSNYDINTGIVTLPSNFTTDNLFEGQILVDTSKNVGYRISAVNDINTFTIDKDINANFTNAYVAPIENFYITQLESMSFKHTYTIRCFVQNDPVFVSYLHALVRFILLRYKETLLEKRGFDRSTIISTGPYNAQSLIEIENTFGQDITLTGYVREYWPKIVSTPLQGIKIYGVEVIGASVTPFNVLPQVDAQGWGMESDFSLIE